ncbi:hypothetical protein CASFOL_014340 [Castilleja foliolosa]|uniref:RNase H type-1 domain-containing protein n=1 Tax=Castilleja foliolosa TaxID=1961234 RepID=A0ABD3DRQ0_9LAMI
MVTKQAKDHWFSILQSWNFKDNTGSVWLPPKFGWLKFNMDSTFTNGDAYSGTICRNDKGSILLASSANHKCLDPLTAESIAILDTCLIVSKLNIKNAILESDCLTLSSMALLVTLLGLLLLLLIRSRLSGKSGLLGASFTAPEDLMTLPMLLPNRLLILVL